MRGARHSLRECFYSINKLAMLGRDPKACNTHLELVHAGWCYYTRAIAVGFLCCVHRPIDRVLGAVAISLRSCNLVGCISGVHIAWAGGKRHAVGHCQTCTHSLTTCIRYYLKGKAEITQEGPDCEFRNITKVAKCAYVAQDPELHVYMQFLCSRLWTR